MRLRVHGLLPGHSPIKQINKGGSKYELILESYFSPYLELNLSLVDVLTYRPYLCHDKAGCPHSPWTIISRR